MGRLDGKVAIVTGAARGIGAAEATAFVAEGARPTDADYRLSTPDDVQAFLRELAALLELDEVDLTGGSS